MQVNLLLSRFNSQQNKIPCQQRVSCPNLAPLKHDTVSFQGMKKSQFSGIDHAIVEKYKAPIEKFNTNEDFQNWAQEKVDLLVNKDFGGRQKETKIQRKSMLKEWNNYIQNQNDAYTPAINLLILSTITKDLNPDNDKIPPVLNKEILADCISEIDKNATLDNKYQFDLGKMYETKLRAQYFETDDAENAKTGWVVIPSKDNDPENYEENAEKLRALSHKSWCTKSYSAISYLHEGDFHIYLENGKPKVGVMFVGNMIEEIQGELNNGSIPVAYFEQVQNHIKDNKLKLTDNASAKVVKAEEIKIKVDKVKKDLKSAIETNDTKSIFEYFGIKSEADNEGFLTISKYRQPENFTYYDCCIDENKLLKNVKKISGDADFCESRATNLPNLKFIEGCANFTKSQVKNLPKLKNINKHAYFMNSQIENLPSLESIDGNAAFMNTQVKNLPSLKRINGYANFNNSKIENLPNLQTINGSADFRNTQIKIIPKLQTILGDADFTNSQITSLPKLQPIGGNAYNIDHIKIGTEIN